MPHGARKSEYFGARVRPITNEYYRRVRLLSRALDKPLSADAIVFAAVSNTLAGLERECCDRGIKADAITRPPALGSGTREGFHGLPEYDDASSVD